MLEVIPALTDLLPDDDKDGIVGDNGLVAALAEVTRTIVVTDGV